MGDPVQHKPVKTLSSGPSAGKRNVPFKCSEEEYLHINEDGKKICLPQEPLGELMGDGMTCGGKGGFPCDFGQERFGIPKKLPVSPPPPAPPDQFKPAEPKDLARLITGKAQYNCKTQIGHTEFWTIERDVSVPVVSKEKAEVTRVRLEEAARALQKTIGGCQSVRFIRVFVSPPEEPAQTQQSVTPRTSTARK